MKYPYSVDPANIPDHMSNTQLEWWILFGICVAGKSAKQTAEKLDEFLMRNCYDEETNYFAKPFDVVASLIYQGKLPFELAVTKFGQYDRIDTAMRGAVLLDVMHLTLEDLEAIPGIGPKTARMVILYSDPKATCVPLDTHILKFLRAKGYQNVPTTTPPAGKKYDYLEWCFAACAHAEGKTVRQLDTEVWQSYALEGSTDAATVKPEPSTKPVYIQMVGRGTRISNGKPIC